MNATAIPECVTLADTANARRMAALAFVNLARTELDGNALETDTPDWRDVEAADLLDAARDALAGAP